MKSIQLIIFLFTTLSSISHAKYMSVEAVITKVGDEYLVTHRSSDKSVSIDAFIDYLKKLKNRSTIGLTLLSSERVPIQKIKTILDGASQNPLIEIQDIRLSFAGKEEIERREKLKEGGVGQPASAPEPKDEGDDKPKSESVVHPQ